MTVSVHYFCSVSIPLFTSNSYWKVSLCGQNFVLLLLVTRTTSCDTCGAESVVTDMRTISWKIKAENIVERSLRQVYSHPHSWTSKNSNSMISSKNLEKSSRHTQRKKSDRMMRKEQVECSMDNKHFSSHRTMDDSWRASFNFHSTSKTRLYSTKMKNRLLKAENGIEECSNSITAIHQIAMLEWCKDNILTRWPTTRLHATFWITWGRQS